MPALSINVPQSLINDLEDAICEWGDDYVPGENKRQYVEKVGARYFRTLYISLKRNNAAIPAGDAAEQAAATLCGNFGV